MRKKRAESFIGIHFDFHAMPGQTVTEVVRPELIERLLDAAKPDFVQCDTKGHPGLSSYPTEVGNRAEIIREDPLAMWRRITAERDIALYAHHSGLYDIKIAEQHPDWAVENADGSINKEYLSPFSPYADEVLIPQIKEMYDKYHIDGVWVDGECWGLFLDYGKYATEAYLKETGKAPARIGEDGYEEYREFCREGFRKYVDKYVKALHEYAPDMEVTSNWFYSAYMPEPVSTKVDFLSGDYSCSNALESARYHARCLAARDMTWDLIMWGHNAIPCSWKTHNRSTKELTQYCHEAASTIAHGGSFLFFNIIYRGGGVIQEWMIPTWTEVAKFCRERQEVCHHAKPVKEIAILYNEAKTAQNAPNLYSVGYPELQSVRGWIDILQDSGLNSSVIYEYQLGDKLYDFPVLVVPAVKKLRADSIANICDYVKRGGKLIADAASLKFFEQLTGIGIASSEQRLIYLDGDGALAAAETPFSYLCGEGAEVCADAYDINIYDSEKYIGAMKKNVEDGCAVALAVNLGDVYNKNQSTAIRNFAKQIVGATGFVPTVNVSGESSDYVEVVLTEKNGKLLVNLLNVAGPQAIAAVRSYGQIPPLYDITVTVNVASEPKSVKALPEGELEWSYSDGKVTAKLSKLKIHTCIQIEL